VIENLDFSPNRPDLVKSSVKLSNGDVA